MISVDADRVMHVVNQTRAVGEDLTPMAFAERPRRSALAATFDRAQSQAERAAHRAMKLSSSLSEQLAGNLLSAATDIAGFDDQSAQTIRAIHADHLEIGKTL